jgi:hypothetical protein
MTTRPITQFHRPAKEPRMTAPALLSLPHDPASHPASSKDWAPLRRESETDPALARYIPRTLPGGISETQLYEYAQMNSLAVAIVGPAGSGKTTSVRRFAAQADLPIVIFNCNPQIDDDVVQGSYVPTGVGTELRWRYSALASALRKPSVVLLNESNRMGPRANAMFLSLLQERRLTISRHRDEVVEVHPHCLVVADANPGYRGTQRSDEAFLDRFAIKIEFDYDLQVEKKLIPSAALRKLAASLRGSGAFDDGSSTPVSTRLLIGFVDTARALGWQFAVHSLLNNFGVEDRHAVEMLLHTHSDRVIAELGVSA